MKVERTERLVVDEKGRVIKRTRRTVITEFSEDFGYDLGTRYGKHDTPYGSTMRRIRDAYDEERRSREW